MRLYRASRVPLPMLPFMPYNHLPIGENAPHEVNAIIVPMKDPAALREAIRRAWEDDDYRRKIAERGRQFALSLGGEESLFTNIALTTIDFVRGRPERGARAITE